MATKAHSQYELALIHVRKLLELYGLLQPSLAYTDNMSDKGFLEKSFPSLCTGVVPVDRAATHAMHGSDHLDDG